MSSPVTIIMSDDVTNSEFRVDSSTLNLYFSLISGKKTLNFRAIPLKQYSHIASYVKSTHPGGTRVSHHASEKPVATGIRPMQNML